MMRLMGRWIVWRMPSPHRCWIKKYADRERNAVNAELTMARTRDGMRMAQVSAETINPAHPGSRFSGGNLETLSDKPR